jgi:hypothetical protein
VFDIPFSQAQAVAEDLLRRLALGTRHFNHQ